MTSTAKHEPQSWTSCVPRPSLKVSDVTAIYIGLKAFDPLIGGSEFITELTSSRCLSPGDFLHWSGGQADDNDHHYGDNNAKAIDIEITAYMLLSMTAEGAADAVDNGLPLVYWLSKQRSPGGGFSSTQVRHVMYLFVVLCYRASCRV